MRPLLVGEANPYGGDPSFALYPSPPWCSGERLCRLVLGLDPDEYLGRFDRQNLCPRSWHLPAARARAEEPFTARDGLVLLPHPSGLSRLWNAPGSFARAREVLRVAGVLPGA